MGNFYSRLSYSFGNEDWRTEQKALKIRPDDSVLCVTASGDRPLNLLSTELKELVSIDANPMQTALFDLKCAALKKLDYEEYLAFMGVKHHSNRLETFAKLKSELSSLSSKVWDHHSKKIHEGILYEGAVEKKLKVASKVLSKLRGNKIDRLFSFENLDEQRAFLDQSWHTFLWRKTFQICLHPWLTRIFIKDPGLYAFVDHDIHIGDYLYEKLHTYLNSYIAKESVLLSLIFKGKVDRSSFPPYLNEQGTAQIKKRLDRVKFETIDMASYLEKAPDASIDCFSCSDIASYICVDDFNRMVNGILRTAKPGARFCIRQFLSRHHIPSSISKHFVRDSKLEKELESEDRCFVYNFMCGTINK